MENKDKVNCYTMEYVSRLVMDIHYDLGLIKAKLNTHEKLIYIILSSILALLVKVFLL